MVLQALSFGQEDQDPLLLVVSQVSDSSLVLLLKQLVAQVLPHALVPQWVLLCCPWTPLVVHPRHYGTALCAESGPPPRARATARSSNTGHDGIAGVVARGPGSFDGSGSQDSGEHCQPE